MTSPGPFDDIQTLESLAERFDGNLDRAREMLEDAGVKLFGDAFSRSALLRAIGSELMDMSPPPQATEVPLEVVLGRVFARVGLEIFDVVHRRAVKACIRPRGEGVVVYSAIALDVRAELEERQGEEGSISDVASHFADEDIMITASEFRSIRVFTSRGTHAGVAYFTASSVRAIGTNFVVFVDLSSSRAWMIPTEMMIEHLDGAVSLPYASYHEKTKSLRFGFPRKRSSFDLENRLKVLPRPQ